jgi:hypothetical protein
LVEKELFVSGRANHYDKPNIGFWGKVGADWCHLALLQKFHISSWLYWCVGLMKNGENCKLKIELEENVEIRAWVGCRCT